MELKDIVKGLNDQIQAYSQKSSSNDQLIAAHLKFIRSLLLIVLNVFNQAVLKAEFEEKKEETKSSKKKKKTGGKKASESSSDTVFDLAQLFK
jgi:hypothetical protein